MVSLLKAVGFRAAYILREKTPVDAVELFDRACLRECKIHDKMPKVVPDIAGNPDPMAAALLIECRGQTPEALKMRIAEVEDALSSENLKFGANMSSLKDLKDYPFNDNAEVSGVYIDVCMLSFICEIKSDLNSYGCLHLGYISPCVANWL